ncbi:MAG: RnfABCDGE type electron transport complex subunit D [Candidatus Jettenia sp.]|uniref:Na+-translocating NADH-quinone reductase subunit B n=1 Tax=Candidatus Jettenia caeni TaxID=247490 RepID=I3IH38_9BACT|nr:RnfABCDGE type electron transport complex subunit D [Candidatus Jettenia sp. AMX1]MBC6929087.1 RnfABCDGE type electron transport complex subunit D [Candidatus Jettenia sp.]WKZ16363.1 MAG: RnfABCDGE type electron transport complex subunit D [Candidatus Jettenia caeni]KAA0249300.1 MAG: RnfABCDGE type electron transport complex subunit D [Candidatus Jettenia sp. AMX1]MCE7880343.1 RnfABCDGE type electron transport complex subunit D [Candidatus Jettenia sp. AMX1]MCQ3928456.1 RnfABCDGE type elect
MKKSLKPIEDILSKNLDRTESFIHTHPKINFLFGSLFEAFDSLIRSRRETAQTQPFIRNNYDVKRFMGAVLVALTLGWVFPSIYFYGWQCVIPKLMVSFIVGVFIVDVSWAIIAQEGHISEGGFVSCMFIPAILPPQSPLWLTGLGAALAILFRNILGGVGNNLVNPALFSRLFLTICFPALLVTGYQIPFVGIPDIHVLRYGLDTITHATPLTAFKANGEIPSYLSLFLGTASGSLGETCRLALILSALWLIKIKVANWRIPVSYLGSVFIFSLFFSLILGKAVAPPLFQLFSGGLILGAFFMATDPITATYNQTAKWVFGAGCGFTTVLIRDFTTLPEGVMYAILLMNLLAIPIQSLAVKMRYRI